MLVISNRLVIKLLNRNSIKFFNNFYKKRSIYSNKNTVKEEGTSNSNSSNTFNSEKFIVNNISVSTNKKKIFSNSRKEEEFTTQTNNTSSNNLVFFNHNESDIIKTDTSKLFSSLPEDKFKFQITGEENQILSVNLYPGQEFLCTRTKFLYHTQGVEYERSTQDNSFGGIVNRFLSGAGLVMFRYFYPYEKGFGRICFSENIPSKYMAVRLADYGGRLICAKNSLLMGSADLDIQAVSVGIKIAFLGNSTYFMQKLSSSDPNSLAIIKIGGGIMKKKLRANETIIVRPGQLVYYEESVNYEVKINRSLSTFLVGGISNAFLTGPGEVVLQSLDFEDLIDEIVSRVPSRSRGSSGSSNKTSTDGDTNSDETGESSNSTDNSSSN